MEFTKYIWDLYRNSEKGKIELKFFKPENNQYLSKKFDFEFVVYYFDSDGKTVELNIYDEVLNEINEIDINSSQEAKLLFEEMIVNQIIEDNKKKYTFFFEFIGAISTALFHKFPEYFLPYYFNSDTYTSFLKFCDNFNILLPPNPPRNDLIKRAWFYFELCEVLHKFRMNHSILPDEFTSFIYFFGIDSLSKTVESELPKPSRVYFLGAGGGNTEENNPDFEFLDKIDSLSTNTWGAGGLNIKKGDLILMYCLSPRKHIHSMWRAIEDSFIDPFSYYYYGVEIGFPQKVVPITFQELKQNSILGQNPVIRAHMQGLNGRALNASEFSELIELLRLKGQAVSELPRLPVYKRRSVHIENERDVEVYLIEPLLKDIGLKDNDWVRQLPIRMGRQTKYYPDYAIFVSSAQDKEKARIVLEAKYSINTEKQLEEAFLQVRSYGLRLSSDAIVIADRDFVWLYIRRDDDFEISKPMLKLTWDELTDTDIMYSVKSDFLKHR